MTRDQLTTLADGFDADDYPGGWAAAYDEARRWDLDPESVLDGTEDAAALAAECLTDNDPYDSHDERSEPDWDVQWTARDAWLTLRAFQNAIDAATDRAA
jgi:hypothetical protein